MSQAPEKTLFSVEEILEADVHALNGTTPLVAARGQQVQDERIQKNADRRDGEPVPEAEVSRRETFYRSLNKLKRAALCCSGGGIRSATFCLGVIQALADHDVTSPVPAAGGAQAGPGASAQNANVPPLSRRLSQTDTPNLRNSLLGRFHYLSTVSGGGYVGSWLSSWRRDDDFTTVVSNLIGRPDGGDVEPPEISWLRAYSNYLTPRIGIASADAWAAVAIIVRNLILNWLIIIPVVCLALLSLKIIATASVWIAENQSDWMIPVALLGVIFLVAAQRFTTRWRPTRRGEGDGVTEPAFFRGDLIWAFLSAIALTVFFSSRYVSTLLGNTGSDLPFLHSLPISLKAKVLILTAAAGLVIYAVGWIAARPSERDWRDFGGWTVSGLVYGALVGLGAYLYHVLQSDTNAWPYARLLVPIICGVPWILMSQLAAESIFVGLVSYEKDSDADREWLGRAAGWLATGAIVWALTAFFVFAGEFAVYLSYIHIRPLLGTIGLSGIVTALLGKSSWTAAKPEDDEGLTAAVSNIVITVAGPIFAAALVVVLSAALDRLLLNDSLVVLLGASDPAATQTLAPDATQYPLGWLLIGLGIAALVAWLASSFVNINRFSLHAVYRNRLIRGYLGASRQNRTPDQFTGFDRKDNIRAYKLWPPQPDKKAQVNFYSLFHVVNITLNVVSTKRLAWQERKAEPFTVTPLHCGSAYLGYRRSEKYGDQDGITLGTAMAISGAAVSSNVGYYSSPSITLLLSLFNVRLGWWLGNPGKAGDLTYEKEGPRFAAGSLLAETFGLTTDQHPYVYLSDGGHFEDLGLYEMVRRRCRFIVVIDAGEDADFTFEDLGNAVRKIYVDLGVRITFNGLQALRNRPPAGTPGTNIPYHAIGTIDYETPDGSENGCENGILLYIKPAYHGTEGAGIRSYAAAHPAFPHETTVDQWFTESQFESYRSLGLDITNDILDRQIDLPDRPGVTLRHFLAGLAPLSRPATPAPPPRS
jgi:hypothetical protein